MIKISRKYFPTRSILFIAIGCLQILCISPKAKAKLLNIPYLQAPQASAIVVMVETDSKIPVQIKYWDKSGKLDSDSSVFYKKTRKVGLNSYVHRILLNRLKSGEEYTYKAFSENDSSALYNFKNFDLTNDSFSCAWMSDLHDNTTVSQTISNLVLKLSPNFVFMGGDVCDSKTYESWRKDFFTGKTSELIAQIPFYHTSGNHESITKNTEAFTQNSIDNKNKLYYSFDYGQAHFLVVNTELSLKDSSKQYEFIKHDLENTTKKFKIVVSHKAPIVYAKHHEDIETYERIFKDIFVKYGVDLVVSGHSHFYQHNIVGGIHQLTVAAAGGSPAKTRKGANTIKCKKGYFWGEFIVDSKGIQVKIFNQKGDLKDEFYIDK